MPLRRRRRIKGAGRRRKRVIRLKGFGRRRRYQKGGNVLTAIAGPVIDILKNSIKYKLLNAANPKHREFLDKAL